MLYSRHEVMSNRKPTRLSLVPGWRRFTEYVLDLEERRAFSFSTEPYDGGGYGMMRANRFDFPGAS